MECITHFSHDHPLRFFQLNDFDDPKPYKCGVCGLPILNSPSYTCSVDAKCKFFLHEPCAQLPREFYHDGHCDTLRLEQRMSSTTFFYECKRCDFYLHPLAAKAVQIKSNHISHNSHPLQLFCREMLSQCDVCGEEHKGFFFYCQECDFWVHQDCAILPIIVRLRNHPHPYILTSFDPMFVFQGHDYDLLDAKECSICRKRWRLRYSGIYLCCETTDAAHVNCAKSMMDDLQTNAIEEVIKLPHEDKAFPSLVIRRFAESNTSSSTQLVHHKLPLILVDVVSSSRKAGEDLVCDVCVQPIDHMMSSPVYRCQSDGCHFLAHYMCANHLPNNIHLLYGLDLNGVLLMQDSDDYNNDNFFCSVVPCLFCRRPSNGFVYRFLDQEEPPVMFDIECGFSPRIIKHASHRKHLLFQSFNPVVSCCSRETLPYDTYKCAACDFSIHIRCALLPKKTHHKFDDHPLELIMSHENNKKQELFCEVCEQEIELKLWYYGCHKCEQYFHINCIPTVGYLSKVKFGKTLVHDKIHHNHPLTLTRMLTHERHELCGHCKQIIQGFAPHEMALHCSDCDFWIHFSCASATTGLLDYSKSLIKLEEMLREGLKNAFRSSV